MHKKRLSTSRIIIGVTMLVFISVLLVYQIQESNKPVSLDEKYLSETALNDLNTDIDKIINKIDIREDLTVCLCSLSDGQLATFYLEKGRNSYNSKVRQIFHIDDLPDSPYKDIVFAPILPKHNDIDVYYCVYKDPQEDSIIINQKSESIYKTQIELNGQVYNLGFWCTALSRGTEIDIDASN